MSALYTTYTALALTNIAVNAAVTNTSVLRIYGWMTDTLSNRDDVEFGGMLIHLTPKTLNQLRYVHCFRGHVVSHEEYVWSGSKTRSRDLPVSNAVGVGICKNVGPGLSAPKTPKMRASLAVPGTSVAASCVPPEFPHSAPSL